MSDYRFLIAIVCCSMGITAGTAAGGEANDAGFRPVPAVQALPLPEDQVSVQHEARELCRYYFSRDQKRPFVYPLIGPAGRSLTRMGHPRDPRTHSHHNSVWIAHQDVGGVSFWEDRGDARIVHQHLVRLEDSDTAASVESVNHWVASDGQVLLKERRRITAELQEGGQWLLIIDLLLEPAEESISLGKTPFGMIGVRMAKSIGVHDGGGKIRNSEGGVNESGVFWKSARWVDYSGRITNAAVEGVTLMDHPANPNHPSVFHVRDDGWMGASLTHGEPLTIRQDQPLRLRYGLWIHAGLPSVDEMDAQWKKFAEQELPELTPEKK